MPQQFLLGLCLCLLGAPQTAQQASPPPKHQSAPRRAHHDRRSADDTRPTTQQPDTEKCTVEGLVVDATTGQPLIQAAVKLRDTKSRGRSTNANTDFNGRFLLKEVEPGRYRLRVESAGYAPHEYDQRTRDRANAILDLQPGQQVSDILVSLVPGGAVSGGIYDEDRHPVQGVLVKAAKYDAVNGFRLLTTAVVTRSNDLGEYQLSGMLPGRYFIAAIPLTSAVAVANPTANKDVSAVRGDHAVTYYPGVKSLRDAIRLPVGTGEQVRGIDLSLSPTPAVHLRGRVLDALSGQPARANLSLLWRERGVRGTLFRRDVLVNTPQGVFDIAGVTPGTYALSAKWRANGTTYSAYQTLEVASSDTDKITLYLTPGVDVPGRVRVEADSRLEWKQVQVLLRPRNDSASGAVTALVNADGTFVLEDVADDIYDVFVAGLPQNYYLKAARCGNDEVLDAGFHPQGDARRDLELTLSPGGSRIGGVVSQEEGKAFEGALVVLIPELSRRDQARLYKTATTDKLGQFEFRGIPPGDYELFAWENPDAVPYRDPDFLQAYDKSGETLHVTEGGMYTATLKLIEDEGPF